MNEEGFDKTNPDLKFTTTHGSQFEKTAIFMFVFCCWAKCCLSIFPHVAFYGRRAYASKNTGQNGGDCLLNCHPLHYVEEEVFVTYFFMQNTATESSATPSRSPRMTPTTMTRTSPETTRTQLTQRQTSNAQRDSAAITDRSGPML